jgi:hypothetical protein
VLTAYCLLPTAQLALPNWRTVAAQEIERRFFRGNCLVRCVFRIHLSDRFPGDLGYCLAARDRFRHFNLNRIDARHVIGGIATLTMIEELVDCNS